MASVWSRLVRRPCQQRVPRHHHVAAVRYLFWSGSGGGGNLGWGNSATALDEATVAAHGRWDASRLAVDARTLCVSGDATSTARSSFDPQFAVRVGQSKVCGGGMGVHVERGVGKCGDGAIPCDTVVALYPGIYVPLVPLAARAAARGELVQDVLHLTRLWGGVMLDDTILKDEKFDMVSSYWLCLEVYSGMMCGYRGVERVGQSWATSDYAVGNIVNHPPKGTLPNVAWQEFLWDAGDKSVAANRLHRGLWYMDPTSGEMINMPHESARPKMPLPGVAIVALRDIEPGEELYMDYKLSKPHPEWYSPVVHE